MKVVLIQPPVWGTYDPPLALAQLCGCLKREGHQVYVFDLNIELYHARKENYKNLWAWEQSGTWYDSANVAKFFDDNREDIEGYINRIVNTGARAFCFSVAASSYLSALELARMIKGKAPDAVVVFGGTLFFEKSQIEPILNNGPVDFVISGEGELALCELMDAIEKGSGLESCRGIHFKRAGKIINTGERPLIRHLDELPFLDFSDFPLDKYDDTIHLPLMSSRGCIQQCVFCSSKAFWKGFRAMSGERLYRELQHQVNRHNNIDHIDFLDLLFNGDMKSLISFCELMIKNFSRRRVFWSANVIVRPEMTPQVLRKMKRAGCEHLIYGIETGSQRVLDLMKKRYRICDADEVLKATHEAGIKTIANFMFGFPGEKEEDFQQTLDFIKRNNKYIYRVYPSRTYCAIEEHSYFHAHAEEFGIKSGSGNHLYWETLDGKNTYPERLRRCEEFCQLAFSLGIEVGCGVQTSVEHDRWYNLGHFYEWKQDYSRALDCYKRYYQLDPENEVILNKIRLYSNKLARGDSSTVLTCVSRGRPNSATKRNESADSGARPQVRFTWNIHYDCNYRCSYCFFEGKWEEYKKRNIYLSVEEWMKYWGRVHRRYGRCSMLITGGEPFTYPNFIHLVDSLSQLHYPINISSNASGDLRSFVRQIDPRRVSLSVSFQPEFDRLESFLERVVFLRRHGFAGCINFVAHPLFLKDVEYYLERFESIGERLKVIPFWGEYRDVRYPYGYSRQERELIGIDEVWFNKVRKRGSLCPAGQRAALLFPDGKVARCGQIGERMVVGNFFDPGFKLLEQPLPCDAPACPCNEDEIWPAGETKEDNEDKLSDETETTISLTESLHPFPPVGAEEDRKGVENSILNDDEYNSGKIILSSSPKVIFIQAAGPCNSSCAFCSRGSNYEIFNLDEHRRRFEDKLYPFISKAETLILTGSGEFLLLPQAEGILDFFDGRFPYVEKRFSTNGSTLTPRICERIVNSKSRYTIHISLHASNSRLHNAITRTENFHKIVGQVKYLTKLRKRTGNPEVRMIFVATTLNIEDLPNFVRLSSQLGADRLICYYNYIYIPTQKYLSCFFKQGLTNRMLDEAEALASKLKLKIDLPPRFGQRDYPSPGTCPEPWSQIMFTTQGHVLPCDASEDCRENLQEKGFMEIWNGQYYLNLRRSLIERTASCFRHCLRANPSAVNDFSSHVIYRGKKESEINILWGDNF
jgi:radical SAM superfamily enzyme YgiQ (UPF0313 family)/MoaA/NifB/PqqE/SkfB family radical SAM enzyme